jgi:hypothetical protein
MRLTPLWLVIVSVAICPSPLRADPIRVLEDNREVHVFVDLALEEPNGTSQEFHGDKAQLRGDNLSVATSGFISIAEGAAMRIAEGSALSTLSSSLTDPHHISGAGTTSVTGSASPFPNDLATFALTGVGIVFEVDTPHIFDFSGMFTGTTNGPPPEIAVSTDVSLFRRGSDDSFFRSIVGPESQSMEERRFLVPGAYEFHLQRVSSAIGSGFSFTSFAASGEFSFTLDLTPTPEPASFVLLGSGVMGLLGLRRRRSVDV